MTVTATNETITAPSVVSPAKLIMLGIVRHTISVIGAALVARGYLEPSRELSWIASASDETAGVLLIVSAYVWSAIDKRKVIDWLLHALHIPTTTPTVAAAQSISHLLTTKET